MTSSGARGLAFGVLHLDARRLDSDLGAFTVHSFRDETGGGTALAIGLGDLTAPEPMLARVHSSCVTSEGLGARDCDCADQLTGALEAIAVEGRGLVFYLLQEGRGAGLAMKARDRMLVQASRGRLSTFDAFAELGLVADPRRYDALAGMAQLLGLRAPLRLLTNNPEKRRAVEGALARVKVELASAQSIEGRISSYNADYLFSKRDSGHALGGGARPSRAEPPGPLTVQAPRRSRQHPELVVWARYWLPLAVPQTGRPNRPWVPGTRWLSASVVQDTRTEDEWVVLSRGLAARRRLGAFELELLDRLPGVRSPARRVLHEALRELSGEEGGVVAVRIGEAPPVAEASAGGGDGVCALRGGDVCEAALDEGPPEPLAADAGR